MVGQAGVELAYNKKLMGMEGNKTVVVNSVGREIGELRARRDPTVGRSMQLTIDADVQKATEDGFAASGFDGAAVVLDPRNGEVLAFTSRPAYDPNAFAAGIERAAWAALNSDPLKPLHEPRAAGKVFAGLGLQDGGRPGRRSRRASSSRTSACTAAAARPSTAATSSAGRRTGHGSMDLRHAIEQSCDVYFYTVGNMLGVDRIHKWATLFGLGVKSNIDLPNELQGLVPSTEWKAKNTKEKKWYAGETISVSIGQGQVSVTPISLAVYTATLANGGTRVTPHLVKAMDDGQGLKPVPTAGRRSRRSRSPRRSCRRSATACGCVVNGGSGTARRAAIPGKDVCGKTGTAQVISNQGRLRRRRGPRKNLRDHGWFTFFAPRDNPEIAGVVFLEHGIHSANAASVAQAHPRHLLREEGRPAAAAGADARTDAARHEGSRSRSPVRPARRRSVADVRTPAVLPRRLAAARRHRPAVARSASR